MSVIQTVDAVTGEITFREMTAEEIAAREVRLASMGIGVPVVPDHITRRQCALELHALQYITPQEALNMVKTASVPLAVAGIFDQMVANGVWTPEQRLLAEIDFAADNYYFNNPLIDMMGLTPEAKAQFFISASQR